MARPKRFKDGEFTTISVQLPKDLAKRYATLAKAMGMSNSRFGEYLFAFWIKEMAREGVQFDAATSEE